MENLSFWQMSETNAFSYFDFYFFIPSQLSLGKAYHLDLSKYTAIVLLYDKIGRHELLIFSS